MTVKREMASRAVAEPKSVVRRAKALTIRSSSNFLNAPFFWPGLIQADIALPVILCRLGWTRCE
jgi:hypothetical protein